MDNCTTACSPAPAPQPCPNCGRCPTCGRANGYYPYYTYYPYPYGWGQQSPYWQIPFNGYNNVYTYTVTNAVGTVADGK